MKACAILRAVLLSLIGKSVSDVSDYKEVVVRNPGNRRRFASVMIGALVFGAAFTVNANLAQANCRDSGFHYHWEMFSGTQRTEVRPKDNNSSLYMKATAVDANRTYTAYATAFNGSGYVDVSNGHKYTLRSGDIKELLNWVREDGYTMASIAATKDGPLAMDGSGLWSPDYCK